MNDEINLPDGSENTPLSVGNAQTQLVRDLHVKGDKVYLPETSPVDFNSDEYDDEFLRSLPNDVALEASSVLNNKRNRFTLFGLAFFLDKPISLIAFLSKGTVLLSSYCCVPLTFPTA